MDNERWYSGTVLRGDQYGRTLGFPTINLDPALIGSNYTPGVYAAHVEVMGREHRGALYFGPRITLQETNQVLEIHIINFHGDLYDQTVQFRLDRFIRPPMDFVDTDELRKQLAQDVEAAKSAISA